MALRRTSGTGLSGLLCLLASSPLCAQDDLREVVTLHNGQQVRGRVYEAFEPAEVTLLQGRQRVRIDRARIASMQSLRDEAREFFVRHARLPGNDRYRWLLAEWAESRGLHALARLQAMDVVLREPDHEAARAMLGHRRRGKDWVWPRKDQWFTLAEYEQFCAEWGHAFVLEGEHFVVQTNGGLRGAIGTVFDLERLYVWWFDTFGRSLRLREVVDPKMLVQVWRDRTDFPAWSSIVQPYFKPRVDLAGTTEQSTSYTYFENPSAQRATRLFEVAVQHLLYRTVADDPPFPTQKERLCAWGEVGLGQYVDRLFQGPSGHAEPQPWRMVPEEGQLVLRERSYGLEILTHRQARQFFITVADNTPLDWASAHLFVAYLMDKDRQPTLRDAFLQFLFEALRLGKGESSSAFDKLLGRKIETLEQPWRHWIEAEVQKLLARPGG